MPLRFRENGSDKTVATIEDINSFQEDQTFKKDITVEGNLTVDGSIVSQDADLRFVNISLGTSFPFQPNIGDEIFRSDLDLFFKWTGTEWIEF